MPLNSYRNWSSYPELGAIPSGDHDTDRTQGWRSRDKQLGNKHPENKSANKALTMKILNLFDIIYQYQYTLRYFVSCRGIPKLL